MNDSQSAAVVAAAIDAFCPKTIYFVQPIEGGPIKIGCTSNINRRLAQLKSHYGRPVRLLGYLHGTERTEREMHRRFAHLRIGRTEQFQASKELLDFIGKGIYDLPEDPDWNPMPVTRLPKKVGNPRSVLIPLPAIMLDGSRGIHWVSLADMTLNEATQWLGILTEKASKHRCVDQYVSHRLALMGRFGKALWKRLVVREVFPLRVIHRRLIERWPESPDKWYCWIAIDYETANLDEMCVLVHKAQDHPYLYDLTARDIYEDGKKRFGDEFAKLHIFFYEDQSQGGIS